MVDLKGTYVVECYRNGEKIWEETISNVVTKEGKNHMLKVAISKEESAVASWHVGLIGGNVTPTENDTAQTVLGATGSYQEVQAYVATTRPVYQCSFQNNGVNNSSSVATFQFNANNVAVYGVFIVSNATKGSNSGILLSAGRFNSPKTFSTDDILVVYYYINS